MPNDAFSMIGLWDPKKRVDSFTSSLLSGTATRQPFIGGANGQNVVSDYQPGGRFSSQRSFLGGGDMRTVIPPDNASAARTASVGTPAPSADPINRFNFTARTLGSPAPATAAVPTPPPAPNAGAQTGAWNRFAGFSANIGPGTAYNRGGSAEDARISAMSNADREAALRKAIPFNAETKKSVSWGGIHRDDE